MERDRKTVEDVRAQEKLDIEYWWVWVHLEVPRCNSKTGKARCE